MATLHGCQDETASSVADDIGEATVGELSEIVDRNVDLNADLPESYFVDLVQEVPDPE